MMKKTGILDKSGIETKLKGHLGPSVDFVAVGPTFSQNMNYEKVHEASAQHGFHMKDSFLAIKCLGDVSDIVPTNIIEQIKQAAVAEKIAEKTKNGCQN